MASPARPAGIGDHDLGVASADDVREGRGPGVAPAVGDDDRRTGELVALWEFGHPLAFEHSAPTLVELAGRPPRGRRFLRVVFQGVVGLGRRGWRIGCQVVVGLPVGELFLEGLADQAAQPGGQVDGFLRAESVEPAPHLRSTRKRMAVSGGIRVCYRIEATTAFTCPTGNYKPVHPMCYIGPGDGASALPLRTPVPRARMPRRRHAPPRPAIAHARVSADELADWRAKAAAAGVSLSELLRQAMARTQVWTAPAREVERERTRQIARIGSNLNQIARWAHTKVDDDLAVVEVLIHLVAIERDLAQLRMRGAGDAG